MDVDRAVCDEADFGLGADVGVDDAYAVLGGGIKLGVIEGDAVVVETPSEIDPRGAQRQRRADTGRDMSVKRGAEESRIAFVTQTAIEVR